MRTYDHFILCLAIGFFIIFMQPDSQKTAQNEKLLFLIASSKMVFWDNHLEINQSRRISLYALNVNIFCNLLLRQKIWQTIIDIEIMKIDVNLATACEIINKT